MTNGSNTILKLDSRGWHDQLAQVIAAEDTARFPAALVGALRHVVPFDYSVMFAYRGQERPLSPYDTFTPEQRIIFVTDYQKGPYLLDPFYQVYAERKEPGLFLLREIAPDRFYHSEYYRSYYCLSGLAEKIGFMVSLPHDMMLVISLMRAGTSAPFSDGDMNKLRRMQLIVHATAARHSRNLGHLQSREGETGTASPQLNLQVINAFENFGDGVLTPREREIVRMVLSGHSSNSIGRQFNITTGSVKINRKNIYAKLGISSQSELFSLFIAYLSGLVAPDAAVAQL